MTSKYRLNTMIYMFYVPSHSHLMENKSVAQLMQGSLLKYTKKNCIDIHTILINYGMG